MSEPLQEWAVDGYLKELVRRLQVVAGDELVGVYAGGSYAFGAYEPERSDLDLAGIVASPATQTLKESIIAALGHESLPCPARGLEFVLYRLATVREPSIEAAFELNLNTGARMEFRAEFEPGPKETHWFPIDRSILAQHGIVLFGPHSEDVFARFPRAQLLPVVLEAVRWHSNGLARGDDAVLNACRAWRYAVEEVWSPKPAAGAWALAQPDPPKLVAAALKARSGSGRLDPAAVRLFLQTTARRIERVAEEHHAAPPVPL